MDYNLKSENRKKFQDKSKLKRHHKKDYSKVQKTESTSDIEPKENVERPREYDEHGEPILYSDEEFDDLKNIVPKGSTNTWRYKEEININGLDDDYEDLLKNLDLKKLSQREEFDSGSKKIDVKRLNTEELLNLKIVDKNFTRKRNEDDTLQSVKPKEPITKPKLVHLSGNNKTPTSLKQDEAFLDDLL